MPGAGRRSRPHDLGGELLGPATISACTITMDHNAIICSMNDRLARSQIKMFTSQRGRPKVPFSQCRCHILVVDYRWGSMGSDETLATTGGPRVIGI